MDYLWSSVEFSDEHVRIWCHPEGHKAGEPGGIAIRLDDAGLEELSNLLRGAAEGRKLREED